MSGAILLPSCATTGKGASSTLTSVNKESNGGYPKGEALGSIQDTEASCAVKDNSVVNAA